MAKQIDFYDFIASNPEGLNYRINENGRNLSTGQRKKVLLLRALLSDAEVIILDEVLSGIDTSSRKIIENTLTESNKTVLVISHEPTEGIAFNKTYLLNKGELTLNNA
jgi:subfamily B ATP-binding cassette protein HlyB/CyaB